MSDEKLFDGHRVDGCRGSWINVGTLRDPWKQMCTACRASRQKPVDDDDDQDIVDVINAAEARHMRGLGLLKADLLSEVEAQQDREFEDALVPRYPSAMQMLGGCLVVLAIGAAIGILVWVSMTGGG